MKPKRPVTDEGEAMTPPRFDHGFTRNVPGFLRTIVLSDEYQPHQAAAVREALNGIADRIEALFAPTEGKETGDVGSILATSTDCPMADREKLVEALRGDAKDLGFLATGESAMLATSVAAEIRDHILAAADLLDEGRETEIIRAVEALGVMPDGYCFCAHDRSGAKPDHEPECRDLRAILQPTKEPVR